MDTEMLPTVDDLKDDPRPAVLPRPRPAATGHRAAMHREFGDAMLAGIARDEGEDVDAGTDAHEAGAAFLAGWVCGWRPEWFLNLTTIPAAGGAPIGRSWRASEVAGRQEEIAAWIAQRNARGIGVYFTPNPLHRAVNTKPEKPDIAAAWVLSVDLDPPADARPYAERRNAILAAATALSQDAEAPAWIVDSGNGIGAFFRVQGGTLIEQAEAACKALTRALASRFSLKADGTHNADRLMRLPGTLNWPSARKRAAGYPAEPSRARVLHERAGAVLSAERVATLAALAAQENPKAKARAKVTAGAATTDEQDSNAILRAEWPNVSRLGGVGDLPADLRARLEHAALDRQGFGRRWSGVTEGLADPSGSGLLMALVGCAKAAGFDLLDTARIAWVWENTDGARHLHEQPDPVRAIARAWDRSVADPEGEAAEVAAITAEGWFVVRSKSKVAVGRNDPDGLTLLSRPDFLTLMENRHIVTPKGQKPAALVWLKDGTRPTYEGAGLYPPGATCPDRYLNLWPGWGVEPKGGREGCRRILHHLLQVVCQGNRGDWKYLLRWMAWGVQNPARKQDVAVALVGGQGTGKGAVGTILRRIYGRTSIQITAKEHLTGTYTGHLADKVFVFADEALFARDPTIVGTLKALVTEPTMTIRRMYMDAVEGPNRFRLLLASNEAHVVPVEGDDRRFAVFATAAKRDRAYYDALFAEIEGDGAAAFFALLLRMNLRGWDMRALPDTKARAEQKFASLTGVPRWWASVLSEAGDGDTGLGGPAGWFGTATPKAHLYDHYVQDARRQGARHVLDVRQFWAGLRDMVAFDERRVGAGGTGGRMVRLPSLDDARAAFATKMGLGQMGAW